MSPDRIPLTVIGGYLGAGKTTLVNRLLRRPGGRRLGVIVNDFGALAIDADLLATAGGDGVISLPNGCVCCTVGAGLHEALTSITDRPSPPDHVVIEASGVADPAVVAAWGSVPPFEPAGVIVVAAADGILELSRHRYVGGEVRRQLARADLVVLTKTDLCRPERIVDVADWIDEESGGAPRVTAIDGAVPPDVILGIGTPMVLRNEPGAARSADDERENGHPSRYVTWSWTSTVPPSARVLESFVASLPTGVLRLKGAVVLDDGSGRSVQGVGRNVTVTRTDATFGDSRLVVIGLADELDVDALAVLLPPT